MNEEQALAKIEELISGITNDFQRGLAIGFINACFLSNIIGMSEHAELFERAFAE
ncbi:MAG: hypothetical protein RR633_20745 [Acinetobacter sp.]